MSFNASSCTSISLSCAGRSICRSNGTFVSLWRAEPFEAFCRHLTTQLNQSRQLERQAAAADARELETVERQIGKLIQALKDGIPASVVKAEVLELERRKRELAARPAPPARPILHPDMGELYRTKTQNLRDALTQPDSRPQAADLLRGFVDEIRLTPRGWGAFDRREGESRGGPVGCRYSVCGKRRWLRGGDLNPRPLGYEPNELPDCSTPRHWCVLMERVATTSRRDSL